MRGTINHLHDTRTDHAEVDRTPRHDRSGSPRRPALIAAIALAVTMLFAACSSDDVDEAATTIDDTVDAATDQADAALDDVEVDERSAAIAEVLRQNGATSLATLVTTIDFDDLTESPEFTFFAPNDEAFLDMTADEMADLLANPDEVLAVLRNHVVAERVDAAEVVEMTAVPTEAGSSLDVTVDGETVMVDTATVTQTDLEVGDGVVHIVDMLLLP